MGGRAGEAAWGLEAPSVVIEEVLITNCKEQLAFSVGRGDVCVCELLPPWFL